jgi:hypothetical protein
MQSAAWKPEQESNRFWPSVSRSLATLSNYHWLYPKQWFQLASVLGDISGHSQLNAPPDAADTLTQ